MNQSQLDHELLAMAEILETVSQGTVLLVLNRGTSRKPALKVPSGGTPRLPIAPRPLAPTPRGNRVPGLHLPQAPGRD